jgi:bacteriocin-like protein
MGHRCPILDTEQVEMKNETYAEAFESLTEEELARVSGGTRNANEQIQRNEQGQLVGPVLQKKQPDRSDPRTLIFF